MASMFSSANLTFSALAAFLAFAAYQRAHGNQEVLHVYLACFEHKNSGLVSNTQAECIGRATAYLVNMLSAVLVGGYASGIADANFRNFAGVMRVGKGWDWTATGVMAMSVVLIVIWARVGASKITRAVVRFAGRIWS